MNISAGGKIFRYVSREDGISGGYLRGVALTLLFVFFSSVSLQAADDPEITVLADKSEMYVGDRISLEVTSAPDKHIEMIFPEKPAETGDFSFVSAEPVKNGFLEEPRVGMVYTYSIYKTGTHVIPPLKILYKNEGESGWKDVLSRQVPVEIISLLDEKSKDIKDIKGVFNRSARIWVFLFGFLGVLLIAAITVLLVRKFKKKAIEAAARIRPPDEIAYEKLNELKAMRLPEKGLVKEYYVRLSEIVRYYLEDRFSFRAPEMTSEEFLEGLRESSKLKIEHKQLLREFLSHCDMVKFAKYGPTPLEMMDSFSSAERLVDQTRPPEGGEAE